MLRSAESFSMISLPDLSFPQEHKTNVIALNCWQDICLSKIWIPSHLLTNRRHSNTWATQGVFHTLEKRGHAKQIESFSIYDDDDYESEADIFLSDSDNDDATFNLDGNNCQHMKTKESLEKNEKFSKLKSFPSCKELNVESNISLNEILSSSTEVDITNFEFKNDHNHSHKQIEELHVNKNDKMKNKTNDYLESLSSEKIETKKNLRESMEETHNVSKLKSFSLCKENKTVESNIFQEILNSAAKLNVNNFEFKKEHKHVAKPIETSQSNKKNKNDKKKNKAVKSVTLDKFLEDYTEENRQEDYANDYLRKIFLSQNKDNSEVELKNNFEFPDLTKPKEIQFMHPEKPVVEKSEMSMKSVVEILTQSDETEIDECIISPTEIVTTSPETVIGKFVIENIPPETCRDDIFTLLCGYGEVKKFSLESDGDFLKAFIEIDLVGDIDWIIECLNGTEPFGASSRELKCYKL